VAGREVFLCAFTGGAEGTAHGVILFLGRWRDTPVCDPVQIRSQAVELSVATILVKKHHAGEPP
jgi:tetrahydromethanopterin S-methyltransferase subunit E